jgi:potassium-transporting ATPase potassium-binding subunit
MTANGWLQIFFLLFVVLLITKPLGGFMARVFARERTWLDPVMRPVERILYRLTGVDENHEMDWKEYALALLLFSGVSMILLYALQRAQQWAWLPWNPQKLAGVPPALAFNTAASFTTNTNWQNYSPETTMSYLTQMVGLAYHNWVSAAAGIAFIRGIARREQKTIGNFWVDMVRGTLWILAPLCLVGALLLVSQGVVQNLKPYDTVQLVDPYQTPQLGADGKPVTGPDGKPAMHTVSQQVIAQGPTASQEIIKELGTNGGGFFNANSAHPFENPTPFTNFLEMLCILAIPSAFTFTLGKMTGSPRHGWAVWAAMALLFLAGVSTAYWAEARGNPLVTAAAQHSLQRSASAPQSVGNLEGKEVRFGVANSALFATVTTATSCGAVNSMHDSFTPLGGMIPLINLMLSEVIFGGVGAGMYGMLVFVILSVFIAGLMVGRTPEYLGKKIEAYDVKMAMLVILIFPLVILVFTAISVLYSFGTSAISNAGPHGFTQVLYAFTSSVANNGSAFNGFSGNTPWYNTSLGMAMLLGRFMMILPMLAIAGNLACKKQTPATLGTFPVTGPLFTVLLIGVVVIVGALTFFPALSLGPVLEHLLMMAGKTF